MQILPRQGEVAPKATEGADTEPALSLPPPPSRSARHLPLAGEDQFYPSTSSTQAGTSTPAAPIRVSPKNTLPIEGSRFNSSVRAP